jgi:Flp pilus assembly protein TadG
MIMKGRLTWFGDTKGDLVWTTLVLVAVLIPLGGLSIDVSRYFLLRATLATGADAAAAAAAQCLDIPHFQNTGDTRLLPDCAATEARSAFAANVADLDGATYHPQFTALSIDEGLDEVDVNAQGTIRLIFGMTPAFTVEVQASSRYRMESR